MDHHILNATDEIVGNYFSFVLHDSEHEEDLDGSKTDRQRNELKINNSSEAWLQAKEGDLLTYQWKFRLGSNVPSAPGKFFHIFQIKATQGGESGSPLLSYTISGGKLLFRHTSIGANMDNVSVLAECDVNQLKEKWLSAEVTVLNKDEGYVVMSLRNLETGELLMTYAGQQDMWRRPEVTDPETGKIVEGTEPAVSKQINRPKWGIYRGVDMSDPVKYAEVEIGFTDFTVIRENAEAPLPVCFSHTAGEGVEVLTYVNPSNVPLTQAKVIAAYYGEDDVLLAVNVQDIAIEAREELQVTMERKVPDAVRCRYFMLESMETLRPLCLPTDVPL